MFRGFDTLECWLLAPYIRMAHRLYRDHTSPHLTTVRLLLFRSSTCLTFLDFLITCPVTVAAQP